MTTDHIKVVTELIDSVLDGHDTQRSPEATLYDDVAPVMPAEGVCWRCPAPAAEDSSAGLCGGCRAFLLEDSDEDPTATKRRAFTAPAPTFPLVLGDGPVYVEPDDGSPTPFLDALRLRGPEPDEVAFDDAAEALVRAAGVEPMRAFPPLTGVEVEQPDGTVVVERTDDVVAAMSDRWMIRTEVHTEAGVTLAVSTSFLGVDHDHFALGRSAGVWYETMVFAQDLASTVGRWSTRAEAIDGHRGACVAVAVDPGFPFTPDADTDWMVSWAQRAFADDDD